MIRSNLVSVIMPVYNSEDTVSKAIKSILNQTFENIELIIGDDGSNDKTYDICKDFEKDKPNIKIIKNEKNIGITKTLNKLIKESKGDFIARQDADDFSSEKRIEEQLRYMKKNYLDACTTRARIIETDKVIPNLSFYLPKNIVIKYKNPFIHGSLMIKKEVLNEMNLYNEKFFYAQDYKLMYDLLGSQKKVRILNNTLYFINMENNISSTYSEEQNYFADCVRKNIDPAI